MYKIIILFLLSTSWNSFSKSYENGVIEVYLSTYKDYQAKEYLLEKQIIKYIAQSQKTLDIAVQEIRWSKSVSNTNPFENAIWDRAENGVKIRIVLERSYVKPDTVNLKTYDRLVSHPNINIILDDNPKIMHDKFAIRDHGNANMALLTGSTNFTNTGVRNNYNNLFIVNFEGEKKPYFELADVYQAEFNRLFSGKFGSKKKAISEIQTFRIGQTRITPLMSPNFDPDDMLLEVILGANSTLDVLMFTFGSNSSLLSGIINRFFAVKYVDRKPTTEKKVNVRIGMESQQARFWSAYPALTNLSIPVKLEVNSNAKLHHKVGIIDNKKVIFGSYNWTFSANYENDENVLVVSNSSIAQQFTSEFDELWTHVLKK